MEKKVEDMLIRLYDAVKTPYDEIMVLPFGNSTPEEFFEWLISLSDEEFELLMKTPIIIQAKKFYTDARKKIKI